MRTEFHATSTRRKELVEAIEKTLGVKARYLQAPTFAYQIADFTVTKDGALECTEETDCETVEKLCAALRDAGFGDARAETEAEEQQAGLTVTMPRTAFTDEALENLQRIVNSKAILLKKAIGTEALPIIVTEDQVSFPWFPEPNADEFVTYARLIDSLCEMARTVKRVTAVEHPVESEKYTMRCFLLRLGFIGPECKKMRAILLRNLSGSSAFRTKEEADAFNEKLKATRRAGKAEAKDEE